MEAAAAGGDISMIAEFGVGVSALRHGASCQQAQQRAVRFGICW